MICAISDTLKEKFLSKMVGDVLAAARSGQPFSSEVYIKDTYKQILDRTADRAKAQTFASFIPGNLVSIYAANKEASKYLRSSFLEFDVLRDTFENFDSVGTYLGIGQEAAQAKKQEILEANEASLRVEEDPTAGASPAVVEGTAQPTNRPISDNSFKATGKSALTVFNVVRPDAAPVILASQNFIENYRKAQTAGSNEYKGFKIKIVPGRSIIEDLQSSERDALSKDPNILGIKAIVVDANNNPVRVDIQGNLTEEGFLPNYNLNKPELINGEFVRKIKTEPTIFELANLMGVDEPTAYKIRQKEFRILYNIRKALEQNPSKEIFVNIGGAGGNSLENNQKRPTKIGDIDFRKLNEEFIPYTGNGEYGAKLGHTYFNVSFSSTPLKIDRPGITEILPAETLAKYIFDASIPFATRKDVFERLLYTGKPTLPIKLRQGQVLYNDQPAAEDVVASVLKSVTESDLGAISAMYRANIPRGASGVIDIPYYNENGVNYETMSVIDYLKKYNFTTAYTLNSTKAYLNLDITPENQITFQADVEMLVEPSTSVKEGVSEQKVPKTSNSAKPISLQLDLISLSDQVANQLKEDIITKGLGATFNIEESSDSNITETIPKGKQNSCK